MWAISPRPLSLPGIFLKPNVGWVNRGAEDNLFTQHHCRVKQWPHDEQRIVLATTVPVLLQGEPMDTMISSSSHSDTGTPNSYTNNPQLNLPYCCPTIQEYMQTYLLCSIAPITKLLCFITVPGDTISYRTGGGGQYHIFKVIRKRF